MLWFDMETGQMEEPEESGYNLNGKCWGGGWMRGKKREARKNTNRCVPGGPRRQVGEGYAQED